MDRFRSSRHSRRVILASAPLVVLLLAVLVFGAFVVQGSLVRVVVNFFITVIIVVGLQFFVGNSGVASYAQAAFVGLGAYVTAWLTIPQAVKESIHLTLPQWLMSAQASFLPTVLIATAVGALAALAFGMLIMRMKETAIAMSSLGLLVIAEGIYNNWEGWTRGTEGVFALPQVTTIWLACAVACIAVVVGLTFKFSKSGLRLRGSRDDSLSAETTGVNVVNVRLAAWVCSGAISALAGSMWAQYNLAFGPGQFFFTQVFLWLSMLVIGGMATVSGAVIGAGVVTLLSELLRRVEEGSIFGYQVPQVSGLAQMVLALITLLILIYRRDGILAWWELDEWLRRGRTRFARGKRVDEPTVGGENAGDA